MMGNRPMGKLGDRHDVDTDIINCSMGNIEMMKGRTLEIVDECRDVCRDAMHCVSTAERVPPRLATTYKTENTFAPQSKNLVSIIGGFESLVTGIVNHLTGKFEWGRTRTLENVDACGDVCRDAMHCVSTAERVPPPLATTYKSKDTFAPQSKNLVSIMCGFESSVTGIINYSIGNIERAECPH